jgi:hypothetical protein
MVAEDDATDSPRRAGDDGHPLLFLAALVTFLGGGLWYVSVLATGGDVRLPLAVNVCGAVALVSLTAADSYTDPDSSVASVPGALGTALLMLGAYGLVASVAVAATSPWHGRLDLTIWLGGAAALAAVFGFFTFPAEVLGGDDGNSDRDRGTAEPPEGE